MKQIFNHFATSLFALAICFITPSCGNSGGSQLGNIGTIPPGWNGGTYKKHGSKVGYIWLSPDEGRPFVQQTKIIRSPSDNLDDIVSGFRSGHKIDSVKYFKIGPSNVADVRCRPLPKTSKSANFTRFIIFENETSFDSIMFSGATKDSLNHKEFQKMYRLLGVDNY